MKKEDQVVEQIISMITQGDYDVGDRLPAERELSKTFQASRHTLRGAIRQLAAQGILEVKSGSGCYVNDKLDILQNWAAHPLCQTPSRDIEFLEARFYFYPTLATVAAQNATEEDMEALESCLTRLGKAIMPLDVEALAIENRRFMDRMARSAHNRVLEVSFRPLNRGDDPFFGCFSKTSKEAQESIFADYVEIVKAIKQRDAELAASRIRDHIVRTCRLLSQLYPLKFAGNLRKAVEALTE